MRQYYPSVRFVLEKGDTAAAVSPFGKRPKGASLTLFQFFQLMLRTVAAAV